jgi:hypothetical protein
MVPSSVNRLLLGLGLALVMTTLARGVAVTVIPDPRNKAAAANDELVSLTSSDHGAISMGGVAATVSAGADELVLHGSVYPVAGRSDTDVAEQAAEYNEVVRHRGFRKAILLLIVCGGLIRFLTSHTYLKFIADVLDPKASF